MKNHLFNPLIITLNLCAMVACGGADESGIFQLEGAGGTKAHGGVGGGDNPSSGGSGGTNQQSGGSGSDAGPPPDSGAGNKCQFDGKWASYLEFHTEWAATNVIDAGTGSIRVWLLGDRASQGSGYREQVRLCGITLPNFQTNFIGGNEKFDIRFPAESFDGEGFPEFSWNFDGSFVPGGSFSTDFAALLIGNTMANPTLDAWPARRDIAATDPDGDGHPGLTGQAASGGGFYYPPADLVKSKRARELWIVTRTVAALQGTLSGCGELNGTAEVASIQGEAALQNHIIGCRLTDGYSCSDQQAAFLDDNQPVFRPTGDASYRSLKVDTSAQCANVRGLFQ